MCDCGCEPIGVIADRLIQQLAAGISRGEDRETPAGSAGPTGVGCARHSAGRTGAVVVNLDVAGCRLRRGSAEPASVVIPSLIASAAATVTAVALCRALVRR